LNPSLAVILPVHNAQAGLARRVSEVLDLLPDLAPGFGLIIVDDGSTDQTEEIAHELTQKYPQVRLIRHANQSGMAVAVKTGYEQSCADIIIVHKGADVPVEPLEKMHARRSAERAFPLPKPWGVDPQLIRNLLQWGEELQQAQTRTAPPIHS